MLSKKTLALSMLTASCLCLTAFAGSMVSANGANAEESAQTSDVVYNVSDKFAVYADVWSNTVTKLENAEGADEVILASKQAGQNDDGEQLYDKTHGGWTFNNSDGIGGWDLNGLEMQFYLHSGSSGNNTTPGAGAEWLRWYIGNNIGWYNGSDAGLTLWFRSYDVSKNTTSILIRYQTGAGDVYVDYDWAHDVPIYLDYDYETDTKQAGVAPATGTLNTLKSKIEGDTLTLTLNGRDIVIPMNTEKTGRNLLSDYTKPGMGDSAGFVLWKPEETANMTYENAFAMRIVSSKNVRAANAAGAPQGYEDTTGGDLEYSYNGLGYPVFGSTGTEYSFARAADAYLDKMDATFLVDGTDLVANDVFKLTMEGSNEDFDLLFAKSDDVDKAKLTVKKGAQTVVDATEVPFTWNGRGKTDTDSVGHNRGYNTVSFRNQSGVYSLTVNGTEITAAAEALSQLAVSNDPTYRLVMGVTGSQLSTVTVKRVETAGQKVYESVDGYSVSDNVVIVDSETAGAYKFYTTADTGFTVAKDGVLPADSFQTTFTVVKSASTDNAFRIVLDKDGKQVIVQFDYKTANTADVSLYVKDAAETQIGATATNMSFKWSETESNQLGVVVVNGRLRVLVNKMIALNAENCTEYTSFIASAMTEGGSLVYQSMGDARTAVVVYSSTALVEMNTIAPGWGKGARGDNAVYVYGTDGSTGMTMSENSSELYASDIAINNMYIRVKTADFSTGTLTIGMQDNSDRGQWFTSEGNCGISITITPHTEAGQVAISFGYTAVDSGNSAKLINGLVADWDDGYHDVYITGTPVLENGVYSATDWAFHVDDITVTASDDAAEENFNTLFDTAFNSFKKGSKIGNGYIFTYSDSTVAGFTAYFAALSRAAVVTVTAASSSLNVGGSVQATAKVSPNAALQSGIWSTSDENVITVDENGFVTAVAAGTAEVIFTSEDGTVGKLQITVTENNVNPPSSSDSVNSGNSGSTDSPDGTSDGSTSGGNGCGSVVGIGAAAGILFAAAVYVLRRKNRD